MLIDILYMNVAFGGGYSWPVNALDTLIVLDKLSAISDLDFLSLTVGKDPLM